LIPKIVYAFVLSKLQGLPQILPTVAASGLQQEQHLTQQYDGVFVEIRYYGYLSLSHYPIAGVNSLDSTSMNR